MKEFVDKLIERLEEYKDSHLLEHGSEQCVHCVEKPYNDCEGTDCTLCVWEKSIEIVNQLAEEYKGNDNVMQFVKLLKEICCKEDADYDKAIISPKFLCDTVDTLVMDFVPQNNGWIPCEKQMPPVETEVWIVAKRKWRDGTCRYITTTAMYEDGTVLENDSCWRWEDIEGEWNEEEDCLIIPEGWWENKHYNADGELNHAVDDEVIAWQPLPVPYQPKGE